MSSKPTANTGLPEGFQSPFKRVQMEERVDDSLACIATLTGKSLADINTLAVQLGVPAFGPYFITESKIVALLINGGNLVGAVYKDFKSFVEVPDVAILLVDWDDITDMGRHVIFHRVRGEKGAKDFSYIIDVASWLDASEHFTTALTDYTVSYYMAISARPAPKAR